MARRRPTARGKSSNRKNRQTRRYLTEALESRTYFVVLHAGDVFEFWAESNHIERVVVEGNPGSTTVELIGTKTDNNAGLFPNTLPNLTTMDGQIITGPDAGIVGTGVPAEAFQGGGGGAAGGNGNAPTFYDDLYAIYVSHSDLSTRISVAAAANPILNTPLSQRNRPDTPFTGATPLLINPTNGGVAVTVSTANTGTALLGTRTFPPTGTGAAAGNAQFPANIPIYQPVPITPGQFPTVPPNITEIGAGLTVQQGNNIGEFNFGGTILGDVDIQGSIQLFYAGWIVTGISDGQGNGSPLDPDNFNVDGDIQNFLTNGSTGTNTDSGFGNLASPTFSSGFDMRVGGKAGMVKSFDSFVGGLDVINDPNAPGLTGVPYLTVDRPVRAGTVTSSFDQATFGADPLLAGDTFAGAQFLGTIDNNGNVVVNGGNIGRATDYYAVPLMAGQTVTVRIDGGLFVGVFDSEQRLVATDLSNVDFAVENADFQVTAQLGGIYYFAVSNNSFFSSTGALGTGAYTLNISGVGNLAIGGLSATNNILGLGNSALTGPSSDFHATRGDFGAAFAGGLIMNALAGFSTTGPYAFAVDDGNLRGVEGASLGNGTGPATAGTTTGNNSGVVFSAWPSGFVPNGSVGMLRATSTANASGQGGTGVLLWNIFELALATNAGTLQNPLAASVAIGGDYQMVDAANFFEGELVAAGNIGTIRANAMNSTVPSYIQVNALNDPNKQGRIDLIDVTTSLGILGPGGPAIITGRNGNCRYIHIGDNGAMFRDFVFGGGAPEGTLYQPGETAVITDDSGSNVSLTPQNPADSLIITTYPIRGSGGAAIVRVEVTNVSNLPTSALLAGGVNIVTSGGGTAEIGDIKLDGTGTAVTPPAAAPAPTPPTANAKFTLPRLPPPPTLAVTTAPMDISISGTDTADVYEINGITNTTDGSLIAARGQVTSITNSTPDGEIVNLHLNSLGSLSTGGAVGIALKQNTPATVTGNYIIHKTEDGTSGAPYSYPLFEVSGMARILGNVISISAGQLGNVYTGIISNTNAPNDPVPPVNQPPLPIADGAALQGTSGSVGSFSGRIVGAVVTAGAIGSVSSSGIAWYGSGAYQPAGIFSTGIIGPVNVNGNVSGAIVSTVAQVGLTINNGSLNQGLVTNYSRFDFIEPRTGVLQSPSSATPITFPLLDNGGVTIQGNGGIIGSLIGGEHVGLVTVSDSGYGIFDSIFNVLGDGTFQGISAGGYGLRGITVRGGATVSALNARGSGTSLPITNFPENVRNSERGIVFDPVTGQIITSLGDLDFYLGTSLAVPILIGSTESGVIEDTIVLGSRDVVSMNAWSIRGRAIPTSNPLLVTFNTATILNVANLVSQINVVGPVEGLTVVAGRTGKYKFGGDVSDFNLDIAGAIGSIVFNSSVLGSSSIFAQGPGGRIGSIVIKGNFSGTIDAVRNIGSVTIQGSMIGTIHAASLGTLKLTGGLGNGSLEIDGNVGTIQTVGDLGVPGNTLTINGSLGTLKIGGNLNTNVSVAGNLKQLLVAGSILSATNISITNTIGLLKVTGDIQAGSVISAHLIKKKLIKGQLLGTITTA